MVPWNAHHTQTRYPWLRERIAQGRDGFIVRWVPTAEMPADGFTKRLKHAAHKRFVDVLRLQDVVPKEKD